MTPAADDGPAHQAAAGPFRRILVAWDGSADAVQTAAALAGDGRSHVVALSVLSGAAPRESGSAAGAGQSEHARRAELAFDAARATIARSSPARLTLHMIESPHIAGSVCAYAADHGFDLLVVGRHGDGGLVHPKLGHIAESVPASGPAGAGQRPANAGYRRPPGFGLGLAALSGSRCPR
jgi:nucleotide-binding universal stress UspA family protein